jgi:hypothetical protein
LIDPSDSIVLIPINPSACGPMITPEIISPMIAGIFNLRRRIGDKRIMNSIKENTRTGFLSGR